MPTDSYPANLSGLALIEAAVKEARKILAAADAKQDYLTVDEWAAEKGILFKAGEREAFEERLRVMAAERGIEPRTRIAP